MSLILSFSNIFKYWMIKVNNEITSGSLTSGIFEL